MGSGKLLIGVTLYVANCRRYICRFYRDPDCSCIDLAEARKILAKHDVQLWIGVDRKLSGLAISRNMWEADNAASSGVLTVMQIG